MVSWPYVFKSWSSTWKSSLPTWQVDIEWQIRVLAFTTAENREYTPTSIHHKWTSLLNRFDFITVRSWETVTFSSRDVQCSCPDDLCCRLVRQRHEWVVLLGRWGWGDIRLPACPARLVTGETVMTIQCKVCVGLNCSRDVLCMLYWEWVRVIGSEYCIVEFMIATFGSCECGRVEIVIE